MTTFTLLALTIAGVAWLAASATAVRSVSRIWLRHWVEQQLSGATAAELYLARPQRLLMAAASAVAIIVFLAGTFIGARATGVVATARLGLLYLLAVLVFGQLLPRALARRWATGLIPILLPLLRIVEWVLMPLLFIAQRAVPRARREAAAQAVSESEGIEELLREGELEGVGEHAEIAIISGVVQFGEKKLGTVMTPRSEIFAVDSELPPREIARQVAQSGYSRVPLYRNTVDDIVGMVHVFDVLADADAERPRIRPVADATTEANCNEFLFRMLRERKHLAVVRDAAGSVAGIVTLEDLLEELVGEIRDEHDDPGAGAPGDARGDG